MSGGMVKVTELLGGYQFGTQVFGPFRASKETPYLEVPAALAAALNLPLHPDEVKAREEAQAGQEQGSEGSGMDEILKANQDLKADFDRTVKERDYVQSLLDKTQEGYAAYDAEAKGKIQALTKERDEAQGIAQALEQRLTEAQARITELEGHQPPAPADTPETPAEPAQEQHQGTPLLEGLPHADLLTTNDFGTMEKLAAGLVVAEGETESPVQKIDGVGKKTLEAYAKAVAEWQAGQAN